MYYEAQTKQLNFHFAKADEVFYGGAAGGGKSFAILWDAITFAMDHPKVNVAIFRRTYPELEKSIILVGLEYLPISWYRYNKKEHRLYFNNGSIIEFNYCNYEQDVYQFQSAQYERIYFDELTHFTKFIYLYLLSRCRTVKTNIHPQVKSASNPGNIGHEWVKQRFVKDALPNQLTERVDPETNSTYTTVYIPAKLKDNKYLTQNDAYYKQLMKLPAEERRALLEGDWDVLKGQYFAEWRYDIHTIDAFAIPKWWRRVRCMDWGYANPAVILWIAFDPNGTAFVYRELKVIETTDIELVRKIKELSKYVEDKKEVAEHIDYTIADPSLWSVTQYERGESIAMRMTRSGLTMIKGDNNRLAGWNVLHSYLYFDREHGIKPKLQIFKNCYYLIETIPGLIRDSKRPEDVDTRGEDHAADALRYGLMTKPLLPTPIKKKIPKDSVSHWREEALNEAKKGLYVGSV